MPKLDVAQALRHLFPNADPLIDYEVREDTDEGPRIAEWRLPDPKPTIAQLAAAERAATTARTSEQAARKATRDRIKTAATSAVGKAIETLTANERNAILAVLLYKLDVLDSQGKVRPLDEWAT